MGLISEYVTTVWSRKNKSRYILLGYKFNHMGADLIVKTSHLSEGSEVRVDVVCDGCGKQNNIEYRAYLQCVQNSGKYCCNRCSNSKSESWVPIEESYPNLTKYFKNEEDVKNYTHGARKIAIIKCPECGHEKRMIICQFVFKGFRCNQCSDGFSYPNKFMLNMLCQIKTLSKIQDFEVEKSFKWCKFLYKNKARNGRYDFYIKAYDEKYIIEMDGGFHTTDNAMSGQTKEDSEFIDSKKDELAKKHNMRVIRIDCEKSKMEFIKLNILNSGLLDLLDFKEEDIDWLKCHEYACSSMVKEVCDLWNNRTKDIKLISKTMKVSTGSVRKYLYQGSEMGWCDCVPRLMKQIIRLDNGQIFNNEASANRAVELKIQGSGISKCCKGKIKSAGKHPITGKGLKWMYLEEYIEIVNKEMWLY